MENVSDFDDLKFKIDICYSMIKKYKKYLKDEISEIELRESVQKHLEEEKEKLINFKILYPEYFI